MYPVVKFLDMLDDGMYGYRPYVPLLPSAFTMSGESCIKFLPQKCGGYVMFFSASSIRAYCRFLAAVKGEVGAPLFPYPPRHSRRHTVQFWTDAFAWAAVLPPESSAPVVRFQAAPWNSLQVKSGLPPAVRQKRQQEKSGQFSLNGEVLFINHRKSPDFFPVPYIIPTKKHV